MAAAAAFDVFLSHNSDDKHAVRRIAERLRDRGIRPWFDEWCLVPGAQWQKGLADALQASGSTALFVGPRGTGSWQNAESMLVLDRAFADDSYRVIPVLLPGEGGTPPSLPGFANLFTWVDFRRGIEDDDALDRLVAGIRGAPPAPPAADGATASGEKVESLSDDELSRCLDALGVPSGALSRIAEAVRSEIAAELAADGQYQQSDVLPPVLADPVKARVDAFRRHLLSFVRPERLLADSFYLSSQKINRMFRAYGDRLRADPTVGASADVTPERRFLMLHEYMSAKRRLAFAPTRILLGQEIPQDGDTWVYFTGDFELRLDDSVLDQVPEARQVIESSNVANLYNIVGRLFTSPDPFFFPIVQFDGDVGAGRTTLVASRKYIGIGSNTATGLGQALAGHAVSLAGFGTLNATGRESSELQAIVCRMSLWGEEV